MSSSSTLYSLSSDPRLHQTFLTDLTDNIRTELDDAWDLDEQSDTAEYSTHLCRTILQEMEKMKFEGDPSTELMSEILTHLSSEILLKESANYIHSFVFEIFTLIDQSETCSTISLKTLHTLLKEINSDLNEKIQLLEGKRFSLEIEDDSDDSDDSEDSEDSENSEDLVILERICLKITEYFQFLTFEDAVDSEGSEDSGEDREPTYSSGGSEASSVTAHSDRSDERSTSSSRLKLKAAIPEMTQELLGLTPEDMDALYTQTVKNPHFSCKLAQEDPYAAQLHNLLRLLLPESPESVVYAALMKSSIGIPYPDRIASSKDYLEKYKKYGLTAKQLQKYLIPESELAKLSGETLKGRVPQPHKSRESLAFQQRFMRAFEEDGLGLD